jgi:uncharacterized lipoprotein YmbA
LVYHRAALTGIVATHLKLVLVVLLAVAGCRSSSPHHYLLAPQADSKAGAKSPASRLAIGIGPVVFPEHLNRTQLVRRLGGAEVQVLDLHRWAEPVQASFAAAVAENVARVVGTDRIMIYPWEGGGVPDINLYVRVLRFEFTADGSVFVSMVWSLTDRAGTPLILRHASYEGKATTGSIADVVKALSLAVSSFSRDVGNAIIATGHGS